MELGVLWSLVGVLGTLLARRYLPGFRWQGSDAFLPYLDPVVMGTGEEPDAVLLKDGGLLFGFEVEVPEDAAMTDAELSAYGEAWSEALRELRGGMGLHLVWARQAEQGYLPEQGPRAGGWGAWAVDERRRERFEGSGYRQDRRYLWITWHGAATAPAGLVSLVVRGRRGGSETERRIEGFSRAVARVEALVSRLRDAHFERLRGPSLAEGLWRSLGGEGAVDLPGADWDTALSRSMVSGFRPVIEGRPTRVLTVRAVPSATVMGLGSVAARLDCPFRMVTRWLPLEPDGAERELKARMKGHRDAVRTLRLHLREKREAELEDEEAFDDAASREALHQLGREVRRGVRSGEITLGAFASVLVVDGASEEEAEARAEAAYQALRSVGLGVERETVGAMPALLAAMPGNLRHFVVRPLITSAQLVHLLPVTGAWSGVERLPTALLGEARSPLLWVRGTDGGVVRLAFHGTGDVGHGALFGRTGSGKSTALAALLLAFYHRYQAEESQVFVLDWDHSQQVTTLAAGGQETVLGGEGKGQLQPLRHLDDEEERSFAFGWLCEAVRVILGREGLSTEERERLRSGLGALRALPPAARTLSRLREQVQDLALKEALGEMAAGGRLSLLDGVEAEAEGAGAPSGWHRFEASGLASLEPALRAVVTAAVIRTIRRRVGHRPTVLVMEEVGQQLGEVAFVELVEGMLYGGRKANLSVILTAQEPIQLAQQGPAGERLLEAVRNSSEWLLFGGDVAAESHAEGYGLLGLNAVEVRSIAGLRPARQYYWRSRAGRAFIDFAFSAEELALLGTPGTSESTRKEVERLLAGSGKGADPSERARAWLDQRCPQGWRPAGGPAAGLVREKGAVAPRQGDLV